jgi:hypothetical protein
MPLPPGARLGRYEIVSPLGAGGMGEVYRAHDAGLKRDVAIKILPEEFAGDADRLRRFEQEALATAALNHPNILAVYDVGSHAGGAFVVSELLEGRTLREALAAGPLSLKKAVDYATQIASGLAAAHEKGIVHRDLKPENLFVTRDERVKILDFGIARVLRDSPMHGGAEAATALTMTLPGAILGTVGYMAPEQVRGEVVDHRADIFSFGAVFYEMLTRRRAFQRETVPGTLAAILEDDPPAWTGDGTALSARALRLINRCLEKQPRARFQSARDLSLVLSDEVSDTSLAGVNRGPSSRFAIGLVAAGLAIGALGLWIGSRLAAPTEPAASSPIAITLTLPPGDSWGAGHPVAISGDGKRIVYAAIHDAVQRLYLRALDSPEVRLLEGTDSATLPFLSPDGLNVAFFSGGQLKRTSIGGGLPRVICSAPNPRGGAWGDDDRIVFAPNVASGLLRVPAIGGTPEPFTTLDSRRNEGGHRWPQVLPGATGVLFTTASAGGDVSLAIQSSSSSEHVTIASGGAFPQYVGGRIVYANRNGELLAAPFDPSRPGEIAGAEALHERPAATGTFGDIGFNVAANGTFVYLPFVAPVRSLAVVDRTGASRTLKLPTGGYQLVHLSRDGTRALVQIGGGFTGQDVWVVDIAREVRTPLTTSRQSRFPIWGPGEGVVSFEQAADVRTILSQVVGANGPPTLVYSPQTLGMDPLPIWWSADGKTLVLNQADPTTKSDIWILGSGDPKARPLVRSEAIEYGAGVSADGRWLSYLSNRSGTFEVYVTSFPTPGRSVQVSQGGGQEAVWAKSGDELFFRRTSDQVISVKVSGTGDAPVVGPQQPVAIGSFPLSDGPGIPEYDVFPNGSFLVIRNDERSPVAPPLILLLNWASTSLHPGVKGLK